MRLFEFLLFAFGTNAVTVLAQSTTQVWIEQMYGIRLNTQTVVSIDPTFSALTSDRQWWTADVNPNIEYAITPNLDLYGAITFSYTKQRDISDVFEIRPGIGARYTVYIGNAGWRWYAFGRFEHRELDYVEVDSTISRQRARLRIGTLLPLNGEGLVPGSWYAIADIEPFFNLDGAPPERYNDRITIRTALGYRFDRFWRFELMYAYQLSRTTYSSGFDTESNIIRFRIRLVP